MNPMSLRSIAICLSLLLLPPSLGWAGDGAVVEKRAILRAGPDKSSASISTIAPGTALEILGNESQFMQVQLPNGKIGWVAEQLIKLPSVAQEAVAAPVDNAPPPANEAAINRPGEALAAQPPAPVGTAAPSNGSAGEQLPLLPTLAILLLGGLLGFAGGYAYRERYYRKRLHGLRV
jgi:hypothetical protein